MNIKQFMYLEPIENANLFEFKTIWKFTPGFQIAAIVILYLISTMIGYHTFVQHGKILEYPLRNTVLLAPIYEEILFRGLILSLLLKIYSTKKSLIISSILFGLWHVKNVYYLDVPYLVYQIIYTTFIFGPVTAWFALKLKTIWPGVILHYLNNLLAPLSLGIIATLFK